MVPSPLPTSEAGEAIAAWLALGAPTEGSASAARAFQEAALRALFTRLTDADIPRLLDPLFRRPGPDALSLRQTAVGLWLHRHPAAVAAWVLTADFPPGGDTRYHLARQTGQYWSGRDLPAAIAWAEKIPDPALAAGVLELILARFSALDPERALALAEARGPEFFAKLRDTLFEHWAQKDPAAALGRFGRELLDAKATNHHVSSALGVWLTRDTEAALAWLAAEGSGDRMQRVNLFNNALIRASERPGQAGPLADALRRQTDLPDQQDALKTLVEWWHTKEPAAAQAWLKQLPDAAERADLIEALVPTQWHDHLGKPEDFLPLALSLPPGGTRDARLSLLVSTWAQTDPAAAAAWLEEQKKRDPSLAATADRVEGRLVAALAAVDPAAARARYDALPPGPARRAAAPEIALAWSSQDPAAATRWLEQEFPSNPSAGTLNLAEFAGYGLNMSFGGRTDAQNALIRASQILGHATRAWFAREPETALAWADSLPDPARQTLVLSGLSARDLYGDESSGSLSPERHAALLAQIRNPAQREQILGGMVSQWLDKDRDAARAWLEAHDALSPEIAARLLDYATRPTP